MKKCILIGLDEAGRGPLAGPLTVAGVAARVRISNFKFLISKPRKSCLAAPNGNGVSNLFKARKTNRNKVSLANVYDRRHLLSLFSLFKMKNYRCLKNIRDSKKLSGKQRREWLEILKDNFEYYISMVGPQTIDKIGIQKATRLAVARALRKFLRRTSKSGNFLVLLDGSMSAPRHYHQKTIIKGDEKIPLIAAASIIAKCSRDSKMLRFHKKFPQYHFDKHKGYGTKLHYKMLKKFGLSPIHRKSFCK